MIRKVDMKKYKEKSISELLYEKYLIKKDEDLINELRPINKSIINKLPTKKLNSFIDDTFMNKRLQGILFPNSANKEIELFKKNSQSLIKVNKRPVKKKPIKNKIINMKLQERIDCIKKYENEVQNLRNEKIQKNKEMTIRNIKNYQNYKKSEINYDIGKCLKDNKLKEFKKTFTFIKNRILNKSKSQQNLYENNYIKLPNMEINNSVYSRLYFNNVLINDDSNQSRITCKTNQSFLNKSTSTYYEYVDKSNNKKQKHFRVKSALLGNAGKEFSVKIDPIQFKKCILKYSSGPKNLNLNNEIKKFPNSYRGTDENKYDYYNMIFKSGYGLIHVATYYNLPEIIIYILNKGGDINLQDAHGNTALHIAKKFHFVDIFDLLLDYGARTDIKNKEGYSIDDLNNMLVNRND